MMGLTLSRGKQLEPGWAGLDRQDLPPLGPTAEQTRFDVRTWWDPGRRHRPIELEIGSGKGTFLVEQARRAPDANYLGIEYARPFWRYAADRCRRHGLTHVRLLHAEAGGFLHWYVPDRAFRCVHVYFPDPWPKKRHHKRRLITAALLREIHRTLEPAGRVRIVTDHSDYFAWIEQHAAQVADLFEPIPFERPADSGEEEVVGTNFERKYRREGRPFHAMALQSRPS